MLTTLALINETLSRLKEKSDPAGLTELSYWSRASILLKLNIAQDELALSVPGLFKTIDTSLTTTALGAEYTTPATVGKVNRVLLNSIPLNQTTKMAIQQEDPNYVANIGLPLFWYQDLNGTKIGLYPTPITAGGTITLEGEYILANMTDSASSYPMNSYGALRKAQAILIDMVAQVCAAEDGNFAYAQYLEGQAEKKKNELITDWLVLRKTDPKSTIDYKRNEGAVD